MEYYKTVEQVSEYHTVFMERYSELKEKNIVERKLIQKQNDDETLKVTSNLSAYKDSAILLQDDKINNHNMYASMIASRTSGGRPRRSRQLIDRLNHTVPDTALEAEQLKYLSRALTAEEVLKHNMGIMNGTRKKMSGIMEKSREYDRIDKEKRDK